MVAQRNRVGTGNGNMGLVRRGACGAVLAVVASTLGGCAAGGGGSGGGAAGTETGVRLPASAEPAPELRPLGFLAGGWVGVTERARGGALVSEERWSPARGASMVGAFRQVNADGKPAFFEIMAITAEEGGVMLRLRHFHGRLETQPGEEAAMVYRLESVEAGRATFVAVSDTAGVARVTYRRAGPSRLSVDVEFDPAASDRKGYTVEYVRAAD